MNSTMTINTATAIAPQVFASVVAPDASLMEPIRNEGWIKPRGGLWTCPADSEGWAAWCERENHSEWRDFTPWTLTVAESVRVAVIDSRDDLHAILTVYGEDSPYMGRVIDFAAMSRDGWDGIWLTDEGQWATRLSKPGLYGWDLESIVWFRWVFGD